MPRVPRGLWKFFVMVLLMVVVGLGLMALLPKHTTIPFSRERAAFATWLIAAIAAVYLLLSLILGRERTNDLIATLAFRIFRSSGAKQ